MNKEEKLYTELSVCFLQNRLNIEAPSLKQVNEIKAILSHAWLRKRINIEERLSNRERMCLFFAAQGKTYREIAQTLGIKPSTVRSYEKEILRKLFCANMKQAIFVGIKYGDSVPHESS